MCARKPTAQLVREITALPALPTVVQRLLAVLRDPDYTAEQINEVVRTDPALTARVLRLANSPLYGFARDVDTVTRAVVLLGSRSLHSLVAAAGVVATLDRIAGGADLVSLWRHAAYTATGAQVLARRVGHPCPEEAFLAGMIHDIGELALAVIRPRSYAQLQRLPAARRHEAERQELGMSHTRAGHQLLTAWNLPDDLCRVASVHHCPDETTSGESLTLTLVALADMLSRVRGLGQEPPPAEPHLRELVKAARLAGGISAELLHEIDLRYLETSRFLHPDRAHIQAPFAAAEPLRAAVVCGDTFRSRWLHELLAYHGHQIIPFAEWFASPDSTDLVVLDPRCLHDDALAHLAPALARTPDRLALYADPDVGRLARDLPGALPVLPILFSQTELVALAAAGAPTLSQR